jgi:recombination protein RecA
LDPAWAEKNGVNVKALMVSQPDNGEQALDIVQTLVDSGAFSVIVVDSVAALVPKAELEGDFGDSNMGLHARLMSQAMRMLTNRVRKSQCVVIFINQIRMKIGVMFGSPETTTGGRALKFYASVRLDVRRIATLKAGERPYGNRVKIKGVKNKVGIPYREIECDLWFDEENNRYGFDSVGNLVDCAVTAKVIEQKGAWFSYNGERLGQGRPNAIEFVSTNPDLLAKITKQLIESHTAPAVN